MPIVCIQSGIRGISKQQKSCYIFAEVVGIWQLRLKLLALAQGRVVGRHEGRRILLSVKGIQQYYNSLLHCSNDNNNACADVFFSLPLLFSGYSHLLLDSNNVSVMFGSTPIDKTPRKGTDANYMDLGASVVCIYCTGFTVHGLHQAFRFIGKLLAMLCVQIDHLLF